MPEANERLRTEFNEWASQGRGEEMENHHISIAEQTIARMGLAPGQRVLDLGCGAGWATRMLAKAVEGGEGMAVGIDISDTMIARARAASRDVENVMFTVAAADEIPWRDDYFNKVLSIESFYYYPDQQQVLRGIHRVMAPGGALFILINLYKENPYSLRWVDGLAVPVHARSENEYEDMLRENGFIHTEIAHIPDLTPTPDEYKGKWFASASELKEFKRIGALLLVGHKPPAR